MCARKKSGTWEEEFQDWLGPIVAVIGRSERRKWAPVYIRGLMGEGARKSVEPMAERVAPGEVQQLHHFVCASPWDSAAVWNELAGKADAMMGGEGAALIVDDTALVKQGKHSVGVGHQYCGQLGKKANCQSVVTLTLAHKEVPVCVGMRLYLPEAWASDKARRKRAKVPPQIVFKTKWEIALDEVDRLMAQGLRFGDVLADAGYGECAAFRQGLTKRGLQWGVGITSQTQVYPAGVKVRMPKGTGMGRPRRHAVPDQERRSATAMIEELGDKAFRSVSWREGSKGALRAEFARVRVRVADGAKMAQSRRLPGQEAWLVCERRTGNDLRYYLSNLPASASMVALAAQIKRRWSCEQAHQQMKEELGLDHFEGRSWDGLHHHLVLVAVALAFLQHWRLTHPSPEPNSSAGRKRKSQPHGKAGSRGNRRGGKSARRSTPSIAVPASCAQATGPITGPHHRLPPLQPHHQSRTSIMNLAE